MSPHLSDPYWVWIRQEAERVGSDGCTFVSEWNQACCFEHDLACRFGRDPYSAFVLALNGDANPWLHAPHMSRRKADKMFRACNTEDSGFWGDVRGYVRYLGVRLGAFIGVGRKP